MDYLAAAILSAEPETCSEDFVNSLRMIASMESFPEKTRKLANKKLMDIREIPVRNTPSDKPKDAAKQGEEDEVVLILEEIEKAMAEVPIEALTQYPDNNNGFIEHYLNTYYSTFIKHTPKDKR